MVFYPLHPQLSIGIACMPIILSQSWEATAIAAVGNKMPAEKAFGWQQMAGRYVFKHRRCEHHLCQMDELHEKMHLAVRASVRVLNSREDVFSSYAGPLLDEFYYNLDGFFEAMRASHDASLSCLSSANLLLNPPNSLHRFYTKSTGKSEAISTDGEALLRNRLVTFWDSTGKIVKDYRDCLNHYLSLSGPTWQHSANAAFHENVWTLSIHLPDNPETYRYNLFKFALQIDARSFCRKLYEDSDRLLHEILLQCADKWDVRSFEGVPTQMTASSVLIGN